ncbi:MAG: hypothetical protein HN341_12995 [Verrucomicrobia bacterium]|jgi:hypothetical protein|nr:hypothetical protein [Verrucomicrobiota bacterium]
MIVADTHLHLYPHYDFETAVHGCVSRLSSLVPGAVYVGFLAERSGCHVYRVLAAGDGHFAAGDVRIEKTADEGCLVLRCFNSPPLYLCPGRQIVTAERLELLCLTCDAEIPDGLPAETAVQRIREVGGIPVLTWAVGKWLFRRSAVVRSLLDQFGPDELIVGDSAMRPVFWPTPRPMQVARGRGFKVLAGTDPLPASGEERVMGTYASVLDAEFDPRQPRASLRAALLRSDSGSASVGSRSGPFAFFHRMSNARG